MYKSLLYMKRYVKMHSLSIRSKHLRKNLLITIQQFLEYIILATIEIVLTTFNQSNCLCIRRDCINDAVTAD